MMGSRRVQGVRGEGRGVVGFGVYVLFRSLVIVLDLAWWLCLVKHYLASV
jgi:hypothetical protein